MNEDQRTAYTTAAQLYNQELDRLLQRVNFFLIGSSFLIVGYITLLNTPVDLLAAWAPRHYWFTWVVNITGLILAIFFAVTNYWNTILLGTMGNYLHEKECGSIDERAFPFNYVKNKMPCREQIGYRNIASRFYSDLRNFTSNPFSSGLLAPHTWLIPFGFIHFWWIAAALPYIIRLI